LIICPVTLVKNEEVWIARVLSSLVDVFGFAIVADTGSTDSTIEEIKKIPGAYLMQVGNLSPADLGKARGWMQEEAKERYGATHVFMADGDELYPRKYLRFIRDNPMAENALSGFTSGIECRELDNGEIWVLGDPAGNVVGLNRQTIFSADAKWRGEYPFESPDCYVPGDPSNHYFVSPDPSYRFYHLHQVTRSRHDDAVYMRTQKKYQFSLREAPEIKPLHLWLRSEKEYVDED
jgi:glycosyltransferase involved in cell wall biosynthesis